TGVGTTTAPDLFSQADISPLFLSQVGAVAQVRAWSEMEPIKKANGSNDTLYPPYTLGDETNDVGQIGATEDMAPTHGLSSEEFRTEMLKLTVAIQAAVGKREQVSLPSWLVPIFFTVLLTLLAFIFNSTRNDLQNQVNKLNDQQQAAQNWITRTREELIAHGWELDPNTGAIKKRKDAK